jgi:hypothetical protein
LRVLNQFHRLVSKLIYQSTNVLRLPSRAARRKFHRLWKASRLDAFHWNNTRHAWQHPCGTIADERADYDPRKRYGSYFAADVKPA